VTASSLAEERLTDHFVVLNDIDIDLPSDRPLDYIEQLTALRFDGLDISWGATISKAAIQFTSYAADDGELLLTTVKASMTITGEYAPSALNFSSSLADVSRRRKTVNFATWAPPLWNDSNLAGAAQRTVDLSRVIQEIVAQPGWVSGNSVVIMFQRSSTIWLGGQVDRRRAIFGGNNSPVLTVTFTSKFAIPHKSSLIVHQILPRPQQPPEPPQPPQRSSRVPGPLFRTRSSSLSSSERTAC
jgi:hypothetical protein